MSLSTLIAPYLDRPDKEIVEILNTPSIETGDAATRAACDLLCKLGLTTEESVRKQMPLASPCEAAGIDAITVDDIAQYRKECELQAARDAVAQSVARILNEIVWPMVETGASMEQIQAAFAGAK